MTQPCSAQKRLKLNITSWKVRPRRGCPARLRLGFFIEQLPGNQLALTVVFDYVEQIGLQLSGAAAVPASRVQFLEGRGENGRGCHAAAGAKHAHPRLAAAAAEEPSGGRADVGLLFPQGTAAATALLECRQPARQPHHPQLKVGERE